MSCFDTNFKFSAGEAKRLKIRLNTSEGGCKEPTQLDSLLVAALLVLQDITFAALQRFGNTGNNFKVEYVGGGTAGSEIVTISILPLNGKKITVQIESGVSTASQILTKIQAHELYNTFFTASISGVGSNPQVTAALVAFAGGSGDLIEVEIPTEDQNIVLDQLTVPAVVVDSAPHGKIYVDLTEIETNRMIDGPIFVRVFKSGKQKTHVVEGGVKKQVSQGC